MADSAYQDLLKDTSESKENGNYFLVTITDLEPNTSYPLQFRWTYKDKKINDNWSAVKIVTTPGESEPNTPNFTSSNVDISSPEKIIITWDGKSDDTGNPDIKNYDRVDVYIDGAPFDGTKPAYSFKAPGTTTIAAPAGTYQIVLYAVSKTGKLSPVSSAVTKTVVAAGEVIQTPTLPSGLSAVASPFAVTINWNGAYSSSSFTGFKSIDIYAVGSDLGSTATSAISASNLVGSLTVNDTTNRINVGLDNLKQALSLVSTQAAYTAPIFFYYNARNKNDVKYGSPTYTRINSTTVNPIQANYVDLASGVISIENLVAGNGQFSSWLRTGSAGGSRIELSSVSDFTNNGYTVQKGLVAYSSGNTEIFNLDTDAGTLTINGSGTFTGDLSAGSGNSIFKSDSNGIYLGNASYASAPFSVSRSGVIKAASGTVGGWTLGSTYLQGNNLKLDTTGITVGATTSSYLDISPSAITHRNSDGTASGKFTLTLGSTPTLTISGSINVTGGNAATTTDLAGKISTGGALSDIGAGNITSTYLGSNSVIAAKIATDAVTSGKIAANAVTTGKIAASAITSDLIAADAVVADKIAAGSITAAKIAAATITASEIAANTITASNIAAGTITATEISSSYIYAGTLTGNIIRTANASTYPRIALNETSNQLTFETVSGHSPGNIYGYSAGSYGVLRIGSPYASGYSQAYMTLYSLGSSTSYIDATASVFSVNGTLNVSQGINAGGNAYSTIAYRLRVEGDNSTSGTGYIYANYLGTGTGTTIVQTSSGFLRVSSSSIRYKENIQEINESGYLNIINKLKPVTFNYKEEFAPDDYDKITSGLIAEDVDEINELKTIVNYNENGQPESISYDRLSAMLVLAIKEIKNKLENIEARLDALEA